MATREELLKRKALLERKIELEAMLSKQPQYQSEGEIPIAGEEDLPFAPRPQRETSIGEGIVGGVEAGYGMAHNMGVLAASGVLGMAGAANPFAEQGEGARAAQWAQDKFSFEPKTKAGKETMQQFGDFVAPAVNWLEDKKLELGEGMPGDNPLLATMAHMSPDAILAVLGIPRFKVPTQAKLPKPPKTGEVTPAQNQIAATLKKGTEQDLTKLVDPDPKFYHAAGELGMQQDSLASFGSLNPQFRAVEGGLASVPSSVLDVQAKAFITELATKADNIIEQFGGTLDKGQMNIDFKRTGLETISQLADKADEVYGSLSKVLPKSGKYTAPNTVEFLTGLGDDLGGVQNLSPEMGAMLNNLKGEPTLGMIDLIRKKVGAATTKGKGEFRHEDQGLMKAIYARLAKDQDAIANSAGLGDITETAKQLIIKRKTLEDNMVNLLGKDLNQAILTNVGGSLKGLAKGDTGRFQKLMNSIPKEQRQAVLMSSLNDVFRGNAVGKQSLDVTQFTKWYENINRSPTTKNILFDNLPKDTRKAINSLYKVSSGVSRALGDRVTTGRLNAMFNEDTGFIRRLAGRALPPLVAINTGSPTASVATSLTMDFIAQASNGTQKAVDLLASPQFQAVIRRSVKEGVIDGNAVSQGLSKAEQALMKSKQVKDWMKEALTDEQVKRLKLVGISAYLLHTDETQIGQQ